MNLIENDFLSVKIKNAGAELSSIFNKKTGMEYLWQAGAEWPKCAPVLFPFVGQLKNNSFNFANKSYTSDRHGFARTKLFETEWINKTKMIFTLCDDDSTLKIYPFKFKLSIQYELADNKLATTYFVENKTSGKMYFSIGAHPAFKVPLVEGENYSDYYLEFEKRENAVQYCLNNGLLDGTTKPVLNDESILRLRKELFYDDALVFKKLQSETISIRSSKSAHGLHFTFRKFPYFGIWAARDADFVCIEPWHGITDSINHNQQIEKKEGIIAVKPLETFTCGYTIEPF